MFVIAGIEVQKLIKGEDLNTIVSKNPDKLTEEVYMELVRIALIHEALGKEFTDWSFHNFIYQAKNGSGVRLKLMDLGGPADVNYMESLQRRLEKIKQIAHSAYDKDALIDKINALHSRIVCNGRIMTALKQEVLQLLETNRVTPVREIQI